MPAGALNCASASMAACSPSLMTHVWPPSPRPPRSSFALATSPARIAPAAAPLPAPLPRGAAIPLPPLSALFHRHAPPPPRASPAPPTRGAIPPLTHLDLRDDIFTEQLA